MTYEFKPGTVYRTKGGGQGHIFSTGSGDDYPLVGLVKRTVESETEAARWTACGILDQPISHNDYGDLLPPPRELWVIEATNGDLRHGIVLQSYREACAVFDSIDGARRFVRFVECEE